jgi:hypothetical protein
MTQFFLTLSFVAVFGSGIRELGSGMDEKSGSGIKILDPQHWCHLKVLTCKGTVRQVLSRIYT